MKRMTQGSAIGMFVLLIAVGLIGLAGCKGKSAQEKVAEKTVEKLLEKASGGKADFDIQEGKLKIKTDEGESEISSNEREWPKDLPASVPPFAMGKVKGVTRSSEAGKKTWNIILEEIESGANEKYTEKLKSNDWQILQTMTMGEAGIIQAQKNNVVAVAMFNGEDETATISVSTEGEP